MKKKPNIEKIEAGIIKALKPLSQEKRNYILSRVTAHFHEKPGVTSTGSVEKWI